MKKYTEDPRITAYALGDLHGAEAEEIKRVVAQDPELQKHVEQIQATAKGLSALFKKEELVPLKPALREELEKLTKPRMSFKAVWGGLGATLAVAGLAFVISTKEIKTIESQPEVIKPEVAAVQNLEQGFAEEDKLEKEELKPAQQPETKLKKYTSVHQQGGAVKQGATESANVQNKNKDVSKVGMFAALGGSGIRKNLDKSYSGAGEVLGSKFKDTGSGGKGTATMGIAGVGTKGRGTGYGASESIGDKYSAAIELGGVEEYYEGAVDREAVRRVIRAGLREIRGCYERQLKTLSGSRRLEGKVIVALKINEHGRAFGSTVLSSTTGNSNLDKCITGRFATWKYPEAPVGSEAVVHYPIYFRAEK